MVKTQHIFTRVMFFEAIGYRKTNNKFRKSQNTTAYAYDNDDDKFSYYNFQQALHWLCIRYAKT